MDRLLRKRLPLLVLTAYVVLSVTGSFLLGAVEPLCIIKYEMENPVQDKVLVSPGDYYMLYQADEAAVYATADTGRFSPFRMGLQRIVSLFCPPGWGNALSKPPFSSGAKISCINVKDTILLKLRI
ncbi:MAG: hypothetical protein LBK08_01000 [Treponema sp.]|jgi:hypothetical protein|nr:hypothetical protein [Treponema sp.]